MFGLRIWWLAVALLTVAAPAFPQGNPTGTISGNVVDPSKAAMPGVDVTVTSPVLQGTRTAVTSANGDYIVPFLPAGEYTVRFERQGFAPMEMSVSLKMADTQPLNVQMALNALATKVTVSESSDVTTTATVASTVTSASVEVIPLGRTLDAATLLSPAAIDNGPGGNTMISGALSYDNLYLVNGVDVNENQRQQPRTLYIEDAIQETKVSSGNISAEYGRFQGGVINMITKSGGNDFHGSFRTTFTNDAWGALTPYPGDQNLDAVVPAYEMTFGGPVIKDKLWFFAAGRLQTNSINATTPYTGYNYTKVVQDRRGEGKLTYTLNPRNTARLSYLRKATSTTNDSFSTIMDKASLYDDTIDESLLSINYTSVLKSNLFFEGQYSARKMDTNGVGSSYMDLLKGTPIWDRSRGQARFNAPTYCAVCPDAVNLMNNWDAYGKLNYFLSTSSLGSHNIVGGFDVFQEMRKNNQNSSASSFRVQATSTIIDGQNIYPVFKTGTTTYVEWLPVFTPTVGNDLRTYSGFLNDAWRLNRRLSFNLGLRYDRNSTRDQGGAPVGNASTFSPRLGAAIDIKGDGKWIVNAGYAHYVGMFVTQVADAASAAGRQASYSFYYGGPNVNTGATGPYLNAQDALKVLFDWFYANGGTSRTPRSQPTIPGVNTAVAPGIQSANTTESTAGVAHELGSRGSLRADFIYRKFGGIYGDYVNMSTGVVTDPRTGQQFNLDVVNNTNRVERDYKGVSTQFTYRPRRNLLMSGNWMLSWSRGNVEAEDATNIVVRASADQYPEYRQPAWNSPIGYLNGDQRHKIRIWGSYDLPFGKEAGAWVLGMMQRYDSGRPYDYSMSVDTRPFVTNPGYLLPPSTVTYFVSGRGAYRFDGSFRTDVSLVWNHHVRIPKLSDAQFFVRAVVDNVFNNLRLTSFNTTTLGKANDSTLAAFNPFTSTPVEGVNWRKGPSFGQAVSPGSYQSPRDFNFSAGFRF
ncbi:MAG: TonB-dependent receptor [Acidobacteria bacterium]|nr:TonB-dependent receptor [Acidobacteriota bacterium]